MRRGFFLDIIRQKGVRVSEHRIPGDSTVDRHGLAVDQQIMHAGA
jgi:hypothetical protein